MTALSAGAPSRRPQGKGADYTTGDAAQRLEEEQLKGNPNNVDACTPGV